MSIKVAIIVNEDLEKVWECWTQPEHIKEWYHPSDSWYVPSAEVDFKVGGKFKIKLAAMDKSGAGAFDGTYTKIELHQKICFDIDDGRKVVVDFETVDNGILVTEQFEPSPNQPREAQEMGWQILLRSFKDYVEN
jgi:uncharacterized protein YndB with AHSA1/START domain